MGKYADFGLPFLGIRAPWLHRNGVSLPGHSIAWPTARAACPGDAVLAAIDAADTSDVRLIDLSDAVCNVAICRVVVGKIPIYQDSHHLPATYVPGLIPALDRQIGAAARWW